jgi:hypothetical protein
LIIHDEWFCCAKMCELRPSAYTKMTKSGRQTRRTVKRLDIIAGIVASHPFLLAAERADLAPSPGENASGVEAMNMMTNRSKWLGPTVEISFAAWALPIAIAVAFYNFWIVLDGQAYGQFDHPGMSDAAYDSIYVAGGFGVGLVLALVLWLPLLIAALISRFVFRAGGVYW